MIKPYDYTGLEEIIIFQGTDLIELSRDKQYINLIKPSEKDKRYFRYDLQKKCFERINFYKTKPKKITETKTKNITQWFKNAHIITKDLHFGRLILFAKHNHEFERYSNSVRFIEQLGHLIIEAIEQWEALGFEVEEMTQFYGEFLGKGINSKKDYRKLIYQGIIPETSWGYKRKFYGAMRIRPADLRKDLFQYIKKTYTKVNNSLLRELKDQYNNNEYPIEQTLKKLAQTPELQGTLHYTSHGYYNTQGKEKWAFGTSHESKRVRQNLISAIQEYHLEPQALLRWLKKQKNVEKNDIGYLFGANHYPDYLNCELELKNHKYPKMNKYPDNFRTQFHKTQEEYNIIKKQVDERKFKEQNQKHIQLEHTGKKYCILTPTKTQDIHNEANELEHCVRTYIPKIVEGKTLILFLRDKKHPNIPLVTLEVKNGALTQAYGKNDSKPKKEHLNYLRKWCKIKKITPACWHNDLK